MECQTFKDVVCMLNSHACILTTTGLTGMVAESNNGRDVGLEYTLRPFPCPRFHHFHLCPSPTRSPLPCVRNGITKLTLNKIKIEII